MPQYTTQQITERVQGKLEGQGDLLICGAESLNRAGNGQIAFIGDPRYAKAWSTSNATAALVNENIAIEVGTGRAVIRVGNADLAMSEVLDMFALPVIRPEVGRHPTAVVHPSASMGKNIAIGSHCFVGAKARIDDGVVLHSNVTVLDEAVIGAGTELFPGVVIRERCEIGRQCTLHSNACIGTDGFAYRPSSDPAKPGLMKITHIGTVCIGDDVEIGSGTCVDRGKFSATMIGDGTKIDNLCQIGHNCIVGRRCIICGQVGLAGSVTVGDGVVIGGKVGVKDHVMIGAGAKLAAYSAVMNDVPAGEVWGGYPAQEMRKAMRELSAVRKLPELIKLLRKK